jgi:hypothetical protein
MIHKFEEVIDGHKFKMLLTVDEDEDGLVWGDCLIKRDNDGAIIFFSRVEEEVKRAACEFLEFEMPELTAEIEENLIERANA